LHSERYRRIGSRFAQHILPEDAEILSSVPLCLQRSGWFERDNGRKALGGWAMKATIIGDGGWGTALGLVLRENGHDVTLWGPFTDTIAAVRESGENALYLPGVALPDDLTWTTDREQAVANSGLVVLAVPTKYFRDVVGTFRGFIPQDCPVVSVAKGLDSRTNERMTQVAAALLGLPAVAALSGPSHAEEVARRIPTAVVVAGTDPDQGRVLQDSFANPRFRVYTSSDVAGVELGGALKNVIAIAVGVSDGLGFGDNTRAALITRGLAEMTRLGCELGARPATFSGLSGMGDLIVTCTSGLSRNRSVGERIGRGEAVAEILGNMQQAVEGAWNCASARALAHDADVDVPITEEVYGIIHEGRDPHDAVAALLARDVRPE
jgi:glycerol-3-phosphate dehydrogenase (NAD(P)+)